INLSLLIEKLPQPEAGVQAFSPLKEVVYAPFSPYPFSVRDVAVFVQNGVTSDEINRIIAKHGGDLLARVDLFDTFVKKSEDGSSKTSYAFRLVLQSHKETLKDAQITSVMDAIYGEFKEKGWEIR